MSLMEKYNLNHDEKGRFSTGDGGLPAMWGTVSIPEGHVRLFHQTSEVNAEKIGNEGIKIDSARFNEGHPTGIFSSEMKGSGTDASGWFDKIKDMPTVEFHVPKEWTAKSDSGIIFHDVPRENIIAVHQPWHSTVRSIVERGLVADVRAGKYDYGNSDASFKQATDYVKGSPLLKFNPNHDELGRFATSGSPKLTVLGKNDGQNSFFNERTRVVRYQPEGKKPVDYVLFDHNDQETVVMKKPTNGTTIDGWDGSYKGVVGSMVVARGESARIWRSQSEFDGKATIGSIGVNAPHRRRGLASAMLRFHRDSHPELDLQHSEKLLEDGQAWADVVKTRVIKFEPGLIPVLKYNENHDELGRFASAGTGGAGGNGLNHMEIYQLQIGRADELKRAVYRAEEKYQPTEQSTLPRPPYPLRDSYAAREEYEAAYKEYSKKFDEYARQSQQNIQSDLGKKYLDGTASGVQRYISDISNASWFKQAFGDGGVIGTPKVALSSVKAAGSYRVGLLKGSPFSKMYIDKGLSMNEPVILHEFAHYATAISATAKYDGHGKEFVGNHLSVVNNVMGSAYAEGLAKAYAKEGISLGH